MQQSPTFRKISTTHEQQASSNEVPVRERSFKKINSDHLQQNDQSKLDAQKATHNQAKPQLKTFKAQSFKPTRQHKYYIDINDI